MINGELLPLSVWWIESCFPYLFAELHLWIYFMINGELLPLIALWIEFFLLPVCRLAFVNILCNKLRVASPTRMMSWDLLPLPVCRIAFVKILYNKLNYFPFLFVELHFIIYYNKMLELLTQLHDELRVATPYLFVELHLWIYLW